MKELKEQAEVRLQLGTFQVESGEGIESRFSHLIFMRVFINVESGEGIES